MNITKQVWNIIRSDLAIEKDLARGLINVRALARHVIEKYGLKASLDSVISAIRRFETKEKFAKDEKRIANLFKDSAIMTRNNVACITISNDIKKEAINSLNNLDDSINFRIVTGNKTSKIIVDQELVKKVTAQFPQKSIEKFEENLSELSVSIDKEAIKTKGVLARIANEISLANINIEEIISSPPEFLIYVKQEQILKTYESVLKLRQKEL